MATAVRFAGPVEAWSTRPGWPAVARPTPSSWPGFIETPMTGDIFDTPGMEEARASMVAEHKLGRTSRPAEVAAAAAFPLSDDAPFVTGHAFPVDGGYTAGRDHGITRR